MTIELDRRQLQPTVGSVEPSRPWILGLVAVDGIPLTEPRVRQETDLSECECPDDCVRDHENE